MYWLSIIIITVKKYQGYGFRPIFVFKHQNPEKNNPCDKKGYWVFLMKNLQVYEFSRNGLMMTTMEKLWNWPYFSFGTWSRPGVFAWTFLQNPCIPQAPPPSTPNLPHPPLSSFGHNSNLGFNRELGVLRGPPPRTPASSQLLPHPQPPLNPP